MKNMFMLSLRRLFMAFWIVNLAACATYSSSGFVTELDASYQAGLYEHSALIIEQKLDLYDPDTFEFSPVEPDKGEVLLHLEAAENWRLAGNIERSIEHYDAVEALLKDEDTEGFGKKIAEGAGSALVNDTLRSYNPEPAERVLTNYYKALSFWYKGDADFARVEFNRANERARIAVERYAKEIEEQQQEQDESKVDAEKRGAIVSQIDQQFPMISQWEVYEDFVNPAVAYTNAIFLAHSPGSDISKARDLLVRVRGMIGDNPIINDDLENISRYSKMSNDTPVRWIIYEAGLSPTFTQKQFAIPFPFDGAIINAAMAFPELTPRRSGISLDLLSINDAPLRFVELANMEKVMKTEFKKRWPATVTRAVISATTKAILQHQMAKELGPMGNLAGFVYSHATNTADTRIWRSMPEAWYVTKVDASTSSILKIPYGLDQAAEVELPAGRNAFVYIKQPSPNAEPYIDVIEL